MSEPVDNRTNKLSSLRADVNETTKVLLTTVDKLAERRDRLAERGDRLDVLRGNPPLETYFLNGTTDLDENFRK